MPFVCAPPSQSCGTPPLCSASPGQQEGQQARSLFLELPHQLGDAEPENGWDVRPGVTAARGERSRMSRGVGGQEPGKAAGETC